MKIVEDNISSEQLAYLQANSITVPQEHNAIVVHLKDPKYLFLSNGTRIIVKSMSSDPVQSFAVKPGTYFIETDGEIESIASIAIKRPPSLFERQQQGLPALFHLTSDAPDQHIVDGIGEVPADGTSFCTITIQKHAYDGTPLTDDNHQDELFLRTTGGLIMDADGNQHIRSLHLQSGQASFRLVSEPTPRLVTVSVFGREPSLQKAEIQIEFV
jgi:hypothetical protein